MLIGAFPHALLDNEQTQKQLRAACARMLPLAVAFCAAWVVVFLLLAQPGLALLLTFAAAVLGCCWIISERFCLSTGIVLAQVLSMAITTVFCLSFDLPGQAVPRTSHGYFLVVALAGYIDYRREPRPMAVAMICAALCGFVAFSSMPLQFSFARPISQPIQTTLAWINPAATVFLLAACLFFVQRRAATNTKMARDLAGAIARTELELLLYPQVDRSRRIMGAKAVLRWNKYGRSVPADVFMPIAFEADLACQVEAWALSEAVLTLSRWQLRSHTYDLVLTVGLSAECVRSVGFVDALAENLRSHGVHGRHLRVELNGREATAIQAPMLEPLEQLRAIGVSVGLKFGSRDGSLGALERLPLQHIHLDGDIARAASESARSATLAHNIVHLAQALGLQVLAQGIESDAQFEVLRECGCEAFEGPLFGDAMSVQTFDAHVHARADEPSWIEEPTS